MADTIFWNVASGKWDDGASWLGGKAPVSGDTAVVAHGTITSSTPDLSGLTIGGQTIEIIAAQQLSFGNTTLHASTSLTNLDADGLTMSFVSFNSLNGTMTLKGDTDMYLIPDTTSMIANNGNWSVAAQVTLLGVGMLYNTGTIEVGDAADAAVKATLLVPSFGVTTQNDGLISIAGAPANAITDTTASFENVIGTGVIRASHAEVTFRGNVAGGSFEFEDTTAVLQLSNGGIGFDAVIRYFQPGNRIDLGTSLVDEVVYVPDEGGTSGTLSISNAGTLVAALGFEGSYATESFSLSDIGGELSLSVPCFAAGTLLRTARGEVAVEALRVGDEMPTRLGGASALVVWTGRRRVDCRRHPRPQDVLPVRVVAGAFAPGVPARDVVLSPDHAVFEGGGLIPIRYLVNDATIVQEAAEAITYWHVELERHDVIEAAGLAVESYLDTGNRGDFANAPGPRSLYPNFARETWGGGACAPLHLEGPVVEAAQHRLLARARALGWRMARASGLKLFADGRRLRPVVEGTSWLVSLPKGARTLGLESGAGVPERLRPGSGDGRRLGVAIEAPVWNGRAAPLEHPRYRGGWHGPEGGFRWTDGRGELDVRGLSDVAFTLRAVERHWRAGLSRRGVRRTG